MGLPWFRMDSNIANHDKILALIADPSPKKWQAATSYCFAIGWSTGHETNGKVPSYALHAVHGTAATARLLVKYDLWEEATAGYLIRNFDVRQSMAIGTESRAKAASVAGRKANCARWHDEGCECWKVSE